MRISTNVYTKTYEHITMLVNMLKADYPEITDNDVEVYTYRGDRRKGIVGVEVGHVTFILPIYDYVHMFDPY